MAHNIHHDNTWGTKDCQQHLSCLRLVQASGGRTEHHFKVGAQPTPEVAPAAKAPAKKAAARKPRKKAAARKK
jgi:hypothetical protein